MRVAHFWRAPAPCSLISIAHAKRRGALRGAMKAELVSVSRRPACITLLSRRPSAHSAKRIRMSFCGCRNLAALTCTNNWLTNGSTRLSCESPPSDPTGVALDALLEEPMVVALPNGHPLAQRNVSAPITLQALANETFIIYGSQHDPGIHAIAFRAFQAAGFTPVIGQQAPHLASTLNLVAVGLGVSFVPASLQRMHMDGVTYRRLKGAIKLSAPLKLASRRGDPSAVVRNFLSLVKGAAKTSAKSGQHLLGAS